MAGMSGWALVALGLTALQIVAGEVLETAEGKKPFVFGSRELVLENFYLEIVSAFVLSLFAMKYFRGRSTNTQLVTKWITANRDLFLKNFSLVGDRQGLLIKKGVGRYVLWCSGRVNCNYLVGIWQLAKRHDLFTSIYGLFKTQYDTLTIEVDMDPEAISPFVFCVAPAKKEKKIREALQDLDNYGDRLNAASFDIPPGFVVLSDSAEAAEKVMANGVAEIVRKYASYIEYIHFTDQYQEALPDYSNTEEEEVPPPEPETRLRFCFKVPLTGSIAEMGELQELTEFVINCIDNVKIPMSMVARGKAEKLRAKALKERSKITQAIQQEADLKKREEKRLEEKKAAELKGPEAQRKLEEKENKKEKKRMENRNKARVAK